MRTYYKTRKGLENNRKNGDRIYYAANKGWYIVRPKKSKWHKWCDKVEIKNGDILRGIIVIFICGFIVGRFWFA